MCEVSFCFYGQVKNYTKDIFDSFEENIFKPICYFFKPNKVFNYLVTFNNTYIYNPRNKENSEIDYLSILNFINFDDYKIIDIKSEEINRIDEISKESNKRFGGAWGKDSVYSIKYAIRQLYSLDLIKKIYNKSKINIMIRPDVKFLNKISLNKIDINNLDLLIPSFETNRTYYNDRFAICLNKKSFETYCGRFENFLLLDGIYNSENFLMKQIKNNDIKFSTIDTKFVRIRADNKIESRDLYLMKK